jgi:hypothetical protein
LFLSLVNKAIESEIGRLASSVTPFVYVGNELKQKAVSRPPIERVLLGVAFAGELLPNFGGADDRRKLFRFLRSLGRLRWTQYLADLAAFGDFLQGLFREQLNLLFLLFATLSCGDLPAISVRFFGAEPYRRIGAVIHNRAALDKVLQSRLLTPDQLAHLRALKKELPPRAGFGNAVDDFLQLEVPDGDIHNYARRLLTAADAVEPFACGGPLPKTTGYEIWQKLHKMVDAVYAIYNVDRPLVRLFQAIEESFPTSPAPGQRDGFRPKCAHDQLEAFVRTAVELHNAMAIYVEDQRRLSCPTKMVTLADLHWNMTFTNTVCPHMLTAEGATPVERLLNGLRPGSPFRELMSALTTVLTLADGEDFMGFAKRALAASLFDDAVRREWLEERIPKLTAWSMVPAGKLPLPLFLLACLRLEREAPVDTNDPVRSRFGILALLIAIFADDAPDVAGRFCPQSVDQLLPYGWDQHYFWVQQAAKWKTWLDRPAGPAKCLAEGAARAIGLFAPCSETLARIARNGRMDYLWNIPAKDGDGGR